MGNDITYEYNRLLNLLKFIRAFTSQPKTGNPKETIIKTEFNDIDYFSPKLSKAFDEIKNIDEVIIELLLTTRFSNFTHKKLRNELKDIIVQGFLLKNEFDHEEGTIGRAILFPHQPRRFLSP